MFSQDRKQQREFLANSWQKYTSNKPLEPLEEQLVSIIKIHPEYQTIIDNIDSEYFHELGEVNPFLHINLHSALRDQLSLNQPKGVKEVHQKLFNHYKDSHEVEHLMILHGRYVCKARSPHCPDCTLLDLCEYEEKNI